mmetsp:Transcript_170743/g.542539  ORF Transcript_170743/g.542539 Transcript_170743/m.542539 type:complete len:324 (-) Transcript_170743:107-1078(-)
MALQHVLDALLALLGNLRLIFLQRHGLGLVDEFRLRDLRRCPPFELHRPLSARVVGLEARQHLCRIFEEARLDFVGLLVCRVLQAVHELLTALPDARVGTGLAHLGLEVRVEGLLGLGGGLDGSQEGVLQRLSRGQALALLALECAQDEALSLLAAPAGDLDCLGLHVLLALEGEPSGHHAEDDDTQSPDVNLETIVERIELGAPVRLGAALLPQLQARRQVHDGAEVAEVDAAIRVLDLLAVLQVVVALQVAMDDVVLVEPIHALEHHLAHILNARHLYHTFGLPMHLHALDHVSTAVDLKHHAHEDLLVVHVVQLHYTGVS